MICINIIFINLMKLVYIHIILLLKRKVFLLEIETSSKYTYTYTYISEDYFLCKHKLHDDIVA